MDGSFEQFLRRKMSTEHPDTFTERHMARATKEFQSTVKIQFSDKDRQVTYLQLSDGDEFNQGCIELQW